MLKSLFRIAVLLVIGILVYNYFLGDPEEKAQSEKVFGEVKELAISVKDLVKKEKQKFEAGKYDQAIDKVGNLFQKMKEKGSEIADRDYLGELERLEERRNNLRDKLNGLEEQLSTATNSERQQLNQQKEALTEDLDQLLRDAERLIEKAEQ